MGVTAGLVDMVGGVVAEQSGAVVEVRGLVKDFGGLRPLRIQALELQPGDRVAVSGLDAVAAEVFVNLINGAIVPDTGEVRILGQRTVDIDNETDWLASLDRFGIVTRRAALLDLLSVEQNLALPFTLDIDALPGDVRERVARLSRRVGLDDACLGCPVGDCPADDRMRLHLARALALDPAVLLLEHPTVGLDRDQVPGFARDVADAVVGHPLVMLAITEDAGFAGVVARRRLKLQAGIGTLVDARGWLDRLMGGSTS